jgi:hypothetical protein
MIFAEDARRVPELTDADALEQVGNTLAVIEIGTGQGEA